MTDKRKHNYLKTILFGLIKIVAKSGMFLANYLFRFVNLSRREITKYLMKTKAKENSKMPSLYHAFIM